MPKTIPENELLAIHRLLGQFPNGASISQIEAAAVDVELAFSRRTLLRRLTRLLHEGRVQASGSLRGTRYRPHPDTFASGALSSDSELPLSAESQALRHAVSRPLQQREPVGYRREFLLSYPRSGAYLSKSVRTHLRQIGKPEQSVAQAGTFARQLLSRLLIDLSWASSHLEGNTYSLLETERLIAFGQAADGRDALETQMILNHKQAIEFLVEPAGEVDYNHYTLLNLHAILSQNLLANPAAGGRIRQIPVGIGNSVYTPLSTPQLLDEYFQRSLTTAAAIRDPFEQSFFALVHFSYLQVFEDVNKRVARLAANIGLIKAGYCPLSFIDVPKDLYVQGLLAVYELNRIELLRDLFIWGYERSAKRFRAQREELGEPDPFRLQYHGEMLEIVAAVVRSTTRKWKAFIDRWAADHVQVKDRRRFVAMVHAELDSLHAGNFARYRIRPAEFAAWQSKSKLPSRVE